MATQMISVKSSFIREIGYNADHQQALVLFRSGHLYRYSNVPKVTFTRWLKAHSKGKYFCRNIRPNPKYPYAQV